jgi:hypothetical protein
LFETLQNLINGFLAGDSDTNADNLAEKVETAFEEKQITDNQYKELMGQLDFH